MKYFLIFLAFIALGICTTSLMTSFVFWDWQWFWQSSAGWRLAAVLALAGGSGNHAK